MPNTVSIPSPVTAPSDRDLAAEIAALAPWSQNLSLPDGTQTAPGQPQVDQASSTWARFRDFLPSDLSGCTALDIGCNAGFFAIELARRGAHVTALESNPLALRQAHWAVGKHDLADRIELYRGHPYDLARWRGQYDVVLFLGQLQSMRYPLLALDVATQLAKRCLVLQVASTSRENEEANGWWESTESAVEAMVASTGFEVVARPYSSLYICQPRKHHPARPRRSEDAFVAATGTMPAGISRYADDLLVAPGSIAPLALIRN